MMRLIKQELALVTWSFLTNVQTDSVPTVYGLEDLSNIDINFCVTSSDIKSKGEDLVN